MSMKHAPEAPGKRAVVGCRMSNTDKARQGPKSWPAGTLLARDREAGEKSESRGAIWYEASDEYTGGSTGASRAWFRSRPT